MVLKIGSSLKLNIKKKFRNKEYRDSFIRCRLKSEICHQLIKARGNKTQHEFADLMGKKQAAIARMESMNRQGNITIETLLDAANAANMGITIKFVSIKEWLKIHDM